MTTESVLSARPGIRLSAHPNCVVCSPGNELGLHLVFTLLEGGGVETSFDCAAIYEGFPGMLHGGVITSLLDGAMTNCLFSQGQVGVTGELKVRFRYPVATGRPATVRAWSEEASPPFHVLKAELMQDQQVKARAMGKFVAHAATQIQDAFQTAQYT